MTEPGYAKGQCQNCDGHLEFPTAGIGQTVDCPHCGSPTLLRSHPADIAAPKGSFPARSRRKVLIVLASVVLIVILAAAGTAFYRFKKPGQNPPMATKVMNPTPTHSQIPQAPSSAQETGDLFATGPVRLQKSEGSALVYAVGTIRNDSDGQRFGVKIQLDLLDAQDHKIGMASDYLAILEPHKDWPFRALLTQTKVAKAVVAKIEEQK